MVLLKKDSDIIAIRDVCTKAKVGRVILPKCWCGRLIAITKEGGEPVLYVRGVNPRTKEAEMFYYLDPGDFESDLPNPNEVRVCVVYHDGKRGNIYGCYA